MPKKAVTGGAAKPAARSPAKPRRRLEDLLAEFRQYFGDAAFDPATGRPKSENWDRRLREEREKRSGGGRPAIDPEDLRSERLGLRVHPDLRAELDRAARMDGMRLSMHVERSLIKAINERAGKELLDLIGRYKQSGR